MTPVTFALLLSALPAALAYPKHLGFGHAAVHARGTSHRYHSDSSSGPYGEYNSTSRGPTGTGTGSLVTVTVSPLPLSSYAAQSSSASEAAPQSAEATTTTCTSLTVTTTTTNRVTVTVQPSSAAAPETASSSPSAISSSIAVSSASAISSSSVSSASSIASSSSVAAPVVPTVYSSSSASSAVVLSASSSSSSLNAYTSSAVSTSTTYVLPSSSTSTPVISSTTAPASTSAAAPITAASSSSSASSSAAATPSSYSASAGTKRGLVYNTASLTDAFASAPIGWAYNWAASTSGLPSQFEFVPMLWGLGDHTKGWTAAASSAVSSGSGYLLGFNEPDMSLDNGGSALSPADAVTGWNANMQQFAGGATKLGSPGVTNAPAPMGLTWLGNFVQQCSGCQIDFLNIHWYCGSGDSVASAVADFKDHVGKAIAQANGKPVWITEFRYIGSGSETDFINQVLPWLDATNGIGRYSYFMAKDNYLLSGSGLSLTGQAYVSA